MIIDSESLPFKTCTMCNARWETCRQFVEDSSLVLNGYFADFVNPQEGLILVTHRIAGCGSTLGIKAGQLEHMYTGPRYSVRNTGNPDCHGQCMLDNDFAPCSAECDMRWIRDVMQMIVDHRYPTLTNGPPMEKQPT